MRGLEHHPQFEEVIRGRGYTLEGALRPYTEYVELDPTVQAYRVSLEDAHAQMLKAEMQRRMWQDIRFAAARQGISPGELAVAMGKHRREGPAGEGDPKFEDRQTVSRETREADIKETQDRVRGNLREASKQWEDAHQGQARGIADHIASVAGGFTGGVGMLSGGFIAGGQGAETGEYIGRKLGENFVYVVDGAGQATADFLSRSHKARTEESEVGVWSAHP